MMRNKILIALAPIVLSLPVLQACERSDRSPTASAPGSGKQARTPSAQDRMLESAPPAAGNPSTPGSTSSDTSGSSGSPSGSMSGGSSSSSPSTPASPGSSSNQSGDAR